MPAFDTTALPAFVGLVSIAFALSKDTPLKVRIFGFMFAAICLLTAVGVITYYPSP